MPNFRSWPGAALRGLSSSDIVCPIEMASNQFPHHHQVYASTLIPIYPPFLVTVLVTVRSRFSARFPIYLHRH